MFGAVEGEVDFARQDGELLVLAGVDVLGDRPAGHDAPVEADELPVAVVGDGGVGDPLAGGRVEEGPEAGHGTVSLRHGHRVFGWGRAGPGWRARRRPARSWKPAAALPRSRTPAARPVVAASAGPDMVAARMTGPAISAQPTGRRRGMWTLWPSQSSSIPIVIAMDGSTQSRWPAAMSTTGSTKVTASWMTVTAFTDRPIRLACGPVGRGAVPAVFLMA